MQSAYNNGQSDGKKVSLADLIVLGGGAAMELAAKDAGRITVLSRPVGPMRRKIRRGRLASSSRKSTGSETRESEVHDPGGSDAGGRLNTADRTRKRSWSAASALDAMLTVPPLRLHRPTGHP